MTRRPATTKSREPMNLVHADLRMGDVIKNKTGTDPRRCYTCMTCTNGCPFYAYMDYGPHQVMRLVLLGQRQEVLTCNAIWLCVGCHTCSAACPMAIDIAAVMDHLRRMALEEGVEVAEPGILDFHRQVLKSIERHGRTHKLEIMMGYKAKSGSLLDDFDLGLKMLAKRKLDLTASNVKDRDGLKKLFAKHWR